MYTNISNIIDMLINVLNVHADDINAVIQEYENGRVLSVFKGMRLTLPRDYFPALELEPTNGSNEWTTVYTQSPRYSVDFTLTINNSNDDLGVEYIGTITRMILEIFNNPANMNNEIPYETEYIPNHGYLRTRLQDAFIDNVSYNANKEGTIRVANWTWTGKVLEGFNPSWRNKSDLEKIDVNPHALPPLEK